MAEKKCVFHIRVPDEAAIALRSAAVREERSLNWIVRKAIATYAAARGIDDAACLADEPAAEPPVKGPKTSRRFFLSVSELGLLRQAADAKQTSVSRFVRLASVAAAQQVLERRQAEEPSHDQAIDRSTDQTGERVPAHKANLDW